MLMFIPSVYVKAESSMPDIEMAKAYESREKRVIEITEDKRKSYMSYKAITNTSSPQYKLQERAYTDPETGIRMVGDRYCVATGSGFSHTIGTYLDVTLDSDVVFECIVGDAKDNRHTINSHLQGLDGSTIEFIVDTDALPEEVRQSGDLSSLDEWDSKVVSIVKYIE